MKKLIALLLAVLFAFSLVSVSGAEGNKFSGIVSANDGTSFTVANAYGTRMIFARGVGLQRLPEVGSTVTVEFSGDITAQLVADKVTVENAAVMKAATGIIKGFAGNQIVLETANGVVLTILVGDSTIITGKASTLAVGQSVKVAYSESVQYVTVVDIAVSIEVTALAQKAQKTVIVDLQENTSKKLDKNLINKHLTGKVIKLTDSWITVKTNKGKKWTFRLTDNTDITDEGDLAVGCRAKIYYDGYASNKPKAKKIIIVKAGSSSSSSSSKTKKGICTYISGSTIVVDGSFAADITNAGYTGSGNVTEGTKVSVTYKYDKASGQNIASKVKWYKNSSDSSSEDTTEGGVTIKSKKGYCSSYDGSWIYLDDGFSANCSDAGCSGPGYHGTGTKVKIKYYYDSQLRENIATSVYFYDEDNLPEVEEESRNESTQYWSDTEEESSHRSDGSGMDEWTPSFDDGVGDIPDEGTGVDESYEYNNSDAYDSYDSFAE